MTHAIVSLLVIGAVFGSLLALASRVFAVPVDSRVEAIKDLLPGANCGGCGFTGCSAFAEAVVKGDAAADACPVAGSEAARSIAAVMGTEVADREPEIARILCGGGNREALPRFDYTGIKDCRAAALVAGGAKACTYGCLGFSTCVLACSFDAIYMDANGLPRVIEDRCSACGKCVEACPRDVITLVPVSRRVHVLCNSLDKGARVRKICKVGCIGCRLCVKQCEQEAITIEDNLARIDAAKCDSCGACAAKCPTKAILAPPVMAVREA